MNKININYEALYEKITDRNQKIMNNSPNS